MGQVIHALLTRPPLKHKGFLPKNSASAFPLDLHVLSTPPAFILSQDQTLLLKSSLQVRTNPLADPFPVLTVVWFVYSRIRSEFSQIQGSQTLPLLLEFSGSCILFDLWFSRSVSLSAFQRQLIHTIISPSLCQQLFSTLFNFFMKWKSPWSYGGFYYIISFPNCQGICVTFLNNFFRLFSHH